MDQYETPRIAAPDASVRRDEEAACIFLLFHLTEILYSISIHSGSSAKEEIPELRKMVFRLEGMTPDMRAKLDTYASKLEHMLANRGRYTGESFWPEVAICCHHMANALRIRLCDRSRKGTLDRRQLAGTRGQRRH